MLMHMGQIWHQLPGRSAQFAAGLEDALKRGLVFLRAEDPVPWLESLLTLAGKGCRMRILEWQDAELCPGEFLLSRIYSRREQIYYFPGDPYGEYLASLRTEPTVVWVKNVRDTGPWVAFLQEYRSAGGRALALVLECVGDIPAETPVLAHRIDRNQYRAFATLVAAGLENTEIPDYQAELAAALGSVSPEKCAVLLQMGERLILNPMETARTVGVMDLEVVRSALRQANLVCLYPVIERVRYRFLRKHRAALSRCFPMRNPWGIELTDPMELEIGHLSYLLRERSFLQGLEGAEQIHLCATVRNKIAHNQQVPYATMTVMLGLEQEYT